jgi:hypothetical protein
VPSPQISAIQYKLLLFLFCFGAKDCTQGLAHAKHKVHPPTSFFYLECSLSYLIPLLSNFQEQVLKDQLFFATCLAKFWAPSQHSPQLVMSHDPTLVPIQTRSYMENQKNPRGLGKAVSQGVVCELQPGSEGRQSFPPG